MSKKLRELLKSLSSLIQSPLTNTCSLEKSTCGERTGHLIKDRNIFDRVFQRLLEALDLDVFLSKTKRILWAKTRVSQPPF